MMIPVHFSCVIKLQGAQKILIGYEINHSCGFNLLATSWEIDGETVETVSDFILGGSKITADGDCSHDLVLRRHLAERLLIHSGPLLLDFPLRLPLEALEAGALSPKKES